MHIEINKNYIMNNFDYMSNLDDGSVDMVITDYPYGTNFESNTLYDDSPATVFKNLYPQTTDMYRSLKEGGRFYAFVPDKNIHLYYNVIHEIFGNYRTLTAPTKSSNKIPKGFYRYDSQHIIVATKNGSDRMNLIDIQPISEAWDRDKRNLQKNKFSYQYSSIMSMRANEEKGKHRNAKNPNLIAEWILLNTKEGDVILDPFCGGGSTARACMMTGRNFYTCDLVDYGVIPSIKPHTIIDPCCGSGNFLSEVMKQVA